MCSAPYGLREHKPCRPLRNETVRKGEGEYRHAREARRNLHVVLSACFALGTAIQLHEELKHPNGLASPSLCLENTATPSALGPAAPDDYKSASCHGAPGASREASAKFLKVGHCEMLARVPGPLNGFRCKPGRRAYVPSNHFVFFFFFEHSQWILFKNS